MSERQGRSGSTPSGTRDAARPPERSPRANRLSSSAPPSPLRKVRLLASGRWHHPLTTYRARQLVVVAAARPGAGKSLVAANLAAALASFGPKVVVADFDLGAPCQHALLGLPPAQKPLDLWVQEKRQTRDTPPIATRVRNLRMLPYARARRNDLATRRAIARDLADVDGEIVVVDLGPDNRSDLFEFFATRALRLIVTGGDRSDLEATYGFLESAVRRAEGSRGSRARAELAQFAGGLVGNGISAPEEAETFHAFARMVRAHLGIPLPVVGCLRSSDRFAQSIAARQPLVARRGVDDNVRAFHQMAEWVLAASAGPVRQCQLAGGGEPTAVAAPHPLPADVSAYARRHPRFPVDWTATLELRGGVTAVRVLDVSASGAAIETTLDLAEGERGVLHFDQLGGRPALEVIVKNTSPDLRRLGLGFANPGRATERIAVAAASPLKPTPS